MLKRSIGLGVEYLKKAQGADGAWTYGRARGVYAQGSTALAAYALVIAGVPAADPAVVNGLAHASSLPLQSTYSVALLALGLAEADPRRYRTRIRECAAWLVRAQGSTGMWTYGGRPQRWGDNSNTQFAVLGLWAAERSGVRVPEESWKRVREHFRRTQDPSGGWGYSGRGGVRLSMSAAGVGSLLIAQNRFVQADRRCGVALVDRHVAAGLEHLGRSLSNQPPLDLYTLYAVERAGILSHQTHFGSHDWYRSGVQALLRTQRADGSWTHYGQNVGTALALLFLAKGKAPVVVARLRLPRLPASRIRDVDGWIEFSSRVLARRLTWQAVTVRTPLAQTLLAPILYISGHRDVRLDDETIAMLRRLVASGGTILVNSCAPEFDRAMRRELPRVFGGARLEPLAADHEVYRSRLRIPARQRFLLGMSASCRMPIFYSPRDLSYAWATGRSTRDVEAASAFGIGTNLIVHLVEQGARLDRLLQVRVQGAPGGKGALRRRDAPPADAFVPAQIVHGGDWQTDPDAFDKVLSRLAGRLPLRTAKRTRALSLADSNLFNHPFVILIGHKRFAFGPAGVERLRKLVQRGGLLYVECCCGSPAFDASARALARDLFGRGRLKALRDDHPIFRRGRELLGPVDFTKYSGRGRGRLPLEGIEVGGRLAFVYCPLAVGCALAGHSRQRCRGVNDEETALRFYERLVLYAYGS